MAQPRGPAGRPVVHVHKLIAKAAQDLAHEAFDLLMHDNHFWTEWQALNPNMNRKRLEEKWVSERWSWFIPQARATLTQMLARPCDEDLKRTIYDALLLDKTLVRGRGMQLN